MRINIIILFFISIPASTYCQSSINIEMYWGHDKFWFFNATPSFDSIDYIHAFLKHPDNNNQFFTQQKGSTITVKHDLKSLDGYSLHIVGFSIVDIALYNIPLKDEVFIKIPVFEEFKFISCPSDPANYNEKPERKWKKYMLKNMKKYPTIMVDGQEYHLSWDGDAKYSLYTNLSTKKN